MFALYPDFTLYVNIRNGFLAAYLCLGARVYLHFDIKTSIYPNFILHHED